MHATRSPPALIHWLTDWLAHHLGLPTRLVLETLKPLPPDRKCFRMINGVLVERTVQDVRPALVTNSDGLKKVLDDLVKQYKRQQEDMEKWKVGCLFFYVFLTSTGTLHFCEHASHLWHVTMLNFFIWGVFLSFVMRLELTPSETFKVTDFVGIF